MTETFKLQPLDIEEYSLENGLRVVLNSDKAVPVVSIAVYYNVGSRNERPGRTGFAHLFRAYDVSRLGKRARRPGIFSTL